MKLSGKKVEGICRKIVIINREEGDLKFIFEAILDETEFNELCPRPMPVVKVLPGGKRVADTDHKLHKEAMDDWSMKKMQWSFLKAISATPELEWETVDLGNPETWKNYETELTESGFSVNEKFKLLQGYMYVAGLDQEKVDEAVDSFLADPQETPEE